MSKKKKGKIKVSNSVVQQVKASKNTEKSLSQIFTPYQAPDEVIGDRDMTITANDSIIMSDFNGNFNITNDRRVALFEEGIGFPGYSYLSLLSQRVEYRHIVETRTEEMLRNWVSFTYIDKRDNENQDKIKEIEKAFNHFKIKEVLRKHLNNDGFFGISHIYISLKAAELDEDEAITPLMFSNKKISKDSLIGFKIVEPVWATPVQYNTADPFDKYFYKPSEWWVLGKRYHASRLITLVSNPVPDILKPAFNFGGVSMAYMCKPYIDNWLRTRQSVSDIIHNFSIVMLKTDLSQMLTDNCYNLINRTDLFNAQRDNQSLSILDKDDEDIAIVAAPLANLDKLQAQSQEQIASVAGIPLVKLLGVTPSGLNASSDGEIRCFYDKIASLQEKMLRPAIEIISKVIQLHLFGEIDENITFMFNPLWQLDELQQSQVNMNIVTQVRELVEGGIITKENAAQMLNNADINYMNDVNIQVPDDPYQGGGNWTEGSDDE